MAFIDLTESNGFIGLLCSFIALITISFMSIHFLKVIAKLPYTTDNIWWRFPNKSGLISFISLVFYATFELHIFIDSVYWLSVKNTGRFSPYWCLSVWNEFSWYTMGKATMYLFWIFRWVSFILYLMYIANKNSVIAMLPCLNMYTDYEKCLTILYFESQREKPRQWQSYH